MHQNTFYELHESAWFNLSVLCVTQFIPAVQGGSNFESVDTKHHSSVVLLIMLYKLVLTFETVDEILWCNHSNESYSEPYCPVVLFLLLYKVVLTLESVDEVLKCCHPNKSY